MSHGGRRAAAVLVAAAVAALTGGGTADAAKLVPVGAGFGDPMFIAAPPHDPHRLFVVERSGTIVLLHGGVRKDFAHIAVSTRDHGGLMSMAFAPDYATSGRFYVDYTVARPGDPKGVVIRIAELRRSATDADRADPSSQRLVLAVDHPGNGFHNGGQLQFGPDGDLYVSTGDGGVNTDPDQNGQNLGVLLGKILRIDPRQHGSAPYAVPPDNPFLGRPAARPEIYAYGLRNPWRFSFDRASGAMVIGDVGEESYEEVDYAPRGAGAGANYGWPCREGLAPGPQPCTGSFVDPVFQFAHSGTGCTGAITGGYVVRNHDLDSLYGRYLYTDFCSPSGDIRSLTLGRLSATDTGPTGLAKNRIYSFGEDSCGHLYIGAASGEVDVLLDDGAKLTPCPGGPALTVKRAAEQPVARRYVQARAGCNEACEVLATGTVVLPHAGRSFPLTAVDAPLGANTPQRLRLSFTRDAADAALSTIHSGYSAFALLKLVARDGAGNRTVRHTRVRLVG